MILTVGKGKGFDTVGAAILAAAPGDTVSVSGGTYRENVTVNKSITLVAAEGETAVIDGGWDGKTLSGTFGGTLSATAAGATLDGITVRNAPGRGIGIGASHVTVRNCTVTDCCKGGLGANPGGGSFYDGLLVEKNLIINVGLERFQTGGQVNGSFLFARVRDSVIRNNTIANGLGEGINIDRDCQRNVFENNMVINCAHVGIYVNCSRDNVIRGNVVLWSGAAKPVGKGDSAPAGIIIGDEGPASGKADWSSGNVIMANLVVGSGRLFQVRNNAHNYNTQLDEATRIERNTFVAGPQTTRGIDIAANQRGRPHEAASFADNVIDWTGAPAAAVIAARADAALDFRGNVWGINPTQDVRGAGDVVATGPLLVNPTAALHAEWGTADVGFNIDNYRPLADSAADGKGALGVLPIEPPIEPPGEWVALPRVDYDEALTALLESRKAIDAALKLLDENFNE